MAADWPRTFDTLVGLLKRAAVDAYVCAVLLSHGDKYRPAGDHYEAENPRWAWIARPGESGSGGGYYITNQDWAGGRRLPDDGPPSCPSADGQDVPDWPSECQRIRRMGEITTEIDKIVDPWRQLPDPAGIAPVVETWRAVYKDMSDRTERPDTGAGSLRANLGRIWDKIHGRSDDDDKPMQGSMIETFSAYVDNLRAAVDCCWDASLVVGQAVAAEQALWERARVDFISAVHETISALDRCAYAVVSRQFDFGAYFTVAGVALGAGSLFGGPVGTAATVAGIGLTVLSEVVKPPKITGQDAGAPDAWGIVQGLRQILGQESGLSACIDEEERAIKANLVANLDTLDRHRSALDLTPEPVTSETDMIRTDPALTDYIIDVLMPAVGDELDRLSQTVGNSAREVQSGSVDILRRDSMVGDGPTGPSDAFCDLAYRLRSALGELCLEVGSGGRNLRAAADWLEQSNEAAAQALRTSAVMASEPVVSYLNLSLIDDFRS